MSTETDTQTTPTRAREDCEKAFLAALEQMGSVTAAARAAGIGRSIAYEWREESEPFRAAWESALEAGIDKVEEVAFDLARKGNEKLVMFLLERRRPQQYGRREEITHRGGVEVAPMCEAEVIKRLERLQSGPDS